MRRVFLYDFHRDPQNEHPGVDVQCWIATTRCTRYYISSPLSNLKAGEIILGEVSSIEGHIFTEIHR